MIQKITKRLAATFVAAAIPNMIAGTLVDVDIWKSAVMSGAVAVLGVIQLLAVAAKDGDLTDSEVEAAFGGE